MISSDTNMMRTFRKYFYKMMHVSYFALQDEKKNNQPKRNVLAFVGTQTRGRTHSSENRLLLPDSTSLKWDVCTY